MKKLLILLLFIASYSTAINAQELSYKNLELKIDSLQQQVDKLTYDYQFLDCSSKLDRLNLNLNVYINGLKNCVDRLLITLYNNPKYDSQFYKLTKMDYDTSSGLLDDYKAQVRIMKWSVSSRAEVFGFTESDLKLLESTFKAIDAAVNSAEISLDYYKQVIAVYRDL